MSFFHEKSTDTRVDVDSANGIPDRSEAPIFSLLYNVVNLNLFVCYPIDMGVYD